ncbi:hypothetical protein CXG81DRAFT_15024 [Caulochytrium protostelioides]|uniref:Folylpolyglutamate synthase n=1 Tax=Caulochytrium protostelioides TaxID=1555241 RepID=A0A4P9X031_9FUNG|nr:hypothetical protein CXG81DRAFT_15024 [Caulochytrium protostelioides]|eukprot:RKO99091.1 hypothetical protein CXG81DRAFT_15024 [Caulochytrium protostelioides]
MASTATGTPGATVAAAAAAAAASASPPSAPPQPQDAHDAYEQAVLALNSLQTTAAILEQVRKKGNLLNCQSIPEMQSFLSRIGVTDADLARLRIIHIAGTKGKGSTAAMVERMLRACSVPTADGRRRPLRTGLFTSPHLLTVAERIRIDGAPLPPSVFAQTFWSVWHKLEQTRHATMPNPSADPALAGTPAAQMPVPAKPNYFRYLTVMAFEAFVAHGVDVAIIECGVGGTYDATNVVPQPVVTGITSLGIDHTAVLGNTIESIAQHKAGIMKPGVPCVTTMQHAGRADAVLRAEAQRHGCADQLAVLGDAAIARLGRAVPIGLAGAHQHANAAVALTLVQRWLERAGPALHAHVPAALRAALGAVQWAGRAQTLRLPGWPACVFRIDGAHTPESLAACAAWFAGTQRAAAPSPSPSSSLPPRRALVFTCTHGRQAGTLLPALRALTFSAADADANGDPSDGRAAATFDDVVFVTSDVYEPPASPTQAAASTKVDYQNANVGARDAALPAQHEMAAAWRRLPAPAAAAMDAAVAVAGSVEAALARLMQGADRRPGAPPMEILVTGSLYLVGATLTYLEENPQAPPDR